VLTGRWFRRSCYGIVKNF